MRRASFSLALVLAVSAVGVLAAQTQPDTHAAAGQSTSAKSFDRAADEKAISANIEAFVTAYNARDAAKVAALFTPDAQVVTEEGETVEGRDTIQQVFADVFADSPEAVMEVLVDSIRYIGDDLAVEVGSTKETEAPGQSPEYGRYTVLHVKRDGQWLMALARDTEGEPPTAHERLQPLAWLVGEWVDDGGSSVVRTSCRWSDDQNFLLQDINLKVDGKDAMQVSQRIGWDPVAKRVRSWVFDSEGGFGEGVWAHDGELWIVKSTGVRTDGTNASATAEIVQTSADGYVWRVRDRVAGNEILPPLEVKVVRVPPVPATAER